jgi:hypothetical protein
VRFRTLGTGLLAAVAVLLSAGARLEAQPPVAEAGAAGESAAVRIDFRDFFDSPVGPRGLRYSPKLLALAGRQVEIAGFMVRREAPPKGTLLLAPRPLQLHDHEYGLADDLPASTLHVELPAATGELSYTPARLVLRGRLELGPREEGDGRISRVRLRLEAPPAPEASAAGADRR